MNIKELSEECSEQVILWRRQFHQIPELGFKEYKTQKLILSILKELEVDAKIIANTGVLAEIKGNKAGKCIALRADIDALPINEETHVEYCSIHPGVMHACGHDGHIASLLGAALVLKKLSHQFDGTVRLLFQPSEEDTTGAEIMINEGALDGVSSVFGIHLWISVPAGKISIQSGARMAAADFFEITVNGKKGHGSAPQEAIDAITTASHLVTGLQHIVSRELSPLEPNVITVGSFNAGTCNNVIADKAVITGTVRTFNDDTQKQSKDRLTRYVHNACEMYRANGNLKYIEGAPVLKNDLHLTNVLNTSAKKLFGEKSLAKISPVTGGEDFAYYAQKVPSVFAFVGIGNSEIDCNYPHHNGKFNMDEQALKISVALYVNSALEMLK